MHTAYLWMMMEIIKLITTAGSRLSPKARPSKTEWKLSAIIKTKGVKLHLKNLFCSLC